MAKKKLATDNLFSVCYIQKNSNYVEYVNDELTYETACLQAKKEAAKIGQPVFVVGPYISFEPESEPVIIETKYVE